MDHLHQSLYYPLETDDLHQQLGKTLLDACFENISEASLAKRLIQGGGLKYVSREVASRGAIGRKHYTPRLSFTSSASQDLMSD